VASGEKVNLFSNTIYINFQYYFKYFRTPNGLATFISSENAFRVISKTQY